MAPKKNPLGCLEQLSLFVVHFFIQEEEEEERGRVGWIYNKKKKGAIKMRGDPSLVVVFFTH